MKRIYAEFGFGNETLCSTEVEENGVETRISSFIRPTLVDDYYIRIWIGKRVIVLSTKDRLKTYTKEKSKFKVLFGLGGTE